MGRHRRSAAAPPAPDDRADGAGRKRRVAAPVRTGLLGASAAMAVGAVAVASGLLPGGGNEYTVGSAGGGPVRTEGAPELHQQGGSSDEPTREASVSPSRSAERGEAPAKSSSPAAEKQSATPSQKSKPAAAPERDRPAPEKSETSSEPERTRSSAPSDSKAPASEQPTEDRSAVAPGAGSGSSGGGTTAPDEAAVLAMVNDERAKAGCKPLRADSGLARLAQKFSDDMAARGFFDHTDPDGKTPWDRADKAGVKGLGGENIARGQSSADAVMESWMNSDGHRANILNCDYTRLGVGVHYGPGGPWWTQDFGF
ncbi:CAP domain-containing protein [Streptomyces sp. NRRL F-5135]|uniref:CAP domain-containing protein n=1 Tax=Streptomyces sp. NRRL F-5135 TaxID=1463858 RepID=UPI0004C7CFB2|nr:CAP domain-containing protein [Streptomyces sp. NRRL F-5135]